MKTPDDYTAQRLCTDAAQAVAALLTPGSGFDLDAVNGSARDAVCAARDDLLAVGCLAYVLAAHQSSPHSREGSHAQTQFRGGGGGISQAHVSIEGASLAIAGSASTRNKNFGVSKK